MKLIRFMVGFLIGAILGLLFFGTNKVFAGGAERSGDLYQCTKVEKCTNKTVIKYKTKYRTKTKVIERPVQEIVMRTKTKVVKKPIERVVTKTIIKKSFYAHKNRITLFAGKAYDNNAKLKTHYTLGGYYNSTLIKHQTLQKQDKKSNIGIQYMRDLYTRPSFSIHGIIQYQTISGPSIGIGIGW